jgi:hypothetical protein
VFFEDFSFFVVLVISMISLALLLALRRMSVGGNTLGEHKLDKTSELEGSNSDGTKNDDSRDLIVGHHQISRASSPVGLFCNISFRR